MSNHRGRQCLLQFSGFPAVMLFLLFLIGGCPAVYGQSVVTTTAAGSNPSAVAVDPEMHKVYVTNAGSNNVTVVDELTNSTASINTGSLPAAVALNPVTHKVYVADFYSASVTVIDEATNSTTTIGVGQQPVALAVNPVTNKVYVADLSSDRVTVIDGATNATSTVATGTSPYAVAVDPVTDKIYVANELSNTVTVIDGATNTTIDVSVGQGPQSVAVNPVTDQIYVANRGSSSVTVIDGITNATGTISVGSDPEAIAINPVTDKIYVVSISGTVAVVDGATNTITTVATGTNPSGVAVNSLTNQIYVSNYVSNNVTVIDGITDNTSTIAVGTSPLALGVNPITGRVYVANYGSSNVTVINGATDVTSTVAVGANPRTITVNPVTDKLYVTNSGGDSITAIDGMTNASSTINVGSQPVAVAVDPVTDKIYVANRGSGNVTVIDGATGTVTATVTVGTNPVAVAVNSVTDTIYVANDGSAAVTVIDGSTNATRTVAVGTNPDALAVDALTDKVYVANASSNTVTAINGATDSTSASQTGADPVAVAVNPLTDRIYVANRGSNSLTVIDGARDTTSAINVGSAPSAVAVNPMTDKVYVANTGGSNVTVIDGATNAASTVAVGPNPESAAVNPVMDQVYVANSGGTTVTVLDGATNATSSVSVGTAPVAVAVNSVTGRVYAVNYNSSSATAIQPNPVQPIPITLTATEVSDSLTISAANDVFRTMNTAPSFTVTVESAYSTNIIYSGLTTSDPPPTGLYYSVDGGSWNGTTPTSTGGSNAATFSIVIGRQSVGLHTLYYYAGYGNEAGQNSSGTGTGNSPEISNLGACHFLIEPISTSTSVTADANPQNAGGNVTFTATVTPLTGGSTLSGTVQFYEGAIPLGTAVSVQNNGSLYEATYSTSSLTAGMHTISAVYSGDTYYGSSSGSATEEVAGEAATLVTVSGSGQSAAIGMPFADPLVVKVADSNGIAVPGATVNFSGAGMSFNPAVVSTGSNGEVATSATPSQGGKLTGTAAAAGATSAIFSEAGLQQVATVLVKPASTLYGTAQTTLTATVSCTRTPAPTGTFNLAVNGGAPVSAKCRGTSRLLECTASYPTAALAVSSSPYMVVASLAADNNYLAATGVGTLVVEQAPSAVSLTSSSVNANLNAEVTLTAAVTSQTSGIPTGSVEFLDGSTMLSMSPLNENGLATFTTGALAAGLHQITAYYPGDKNFDGQTSAPLAEKVTAPNFSLTTSASILTVVAGQTAQVTLSIVPVGGFNGTVQFSCSGLPANSQCAFSPASLIADGSNTAQNDQLTISTGAVARMKLPGKPDREMLAGISWISAALFGGLLFWQRRRLTAKYRTLLILLAAAAIIPGPMGCGSARSHAAPGDSLITVTAISGSSSRTATVDLQLT